MPSACFTKAAGVRGAAVVVLSSPPSPQPTSTALTAKTPTSIRIDRIFNPPPPVNS